MKIIKYVDIKNLNISYDTCYHWFIESLKHKSDCVIPKKISFKDDLNFINYMPVKTHTGATGIKIISRNVEATPKLNGSIILFDKSNTQPIAFMDADWITVMRTAAATVNSIDLLAVKNWSSIGMIGLGNISTAILSMLLSIYPDRAINIKLLKYKDTHINFKNKFEKYSNLNFEFVDSLPELVSDSDIIISAPSFMANDVCDIHYYKKGVLVLPVHTRGFINCSKTFDKVFCDDKLAISDFTQYDDFPNLDETADILNKKYLGELIIIKELLYIILVLVIMTYSLQIRFMNCLKILNLKN